MPLYIDGQAHYGMMPDWVVAWPREKGGGNTVSNVVRAGGLGWQGGRNSDVVAGGKVVQAVPQANLHGKFRHTPPKLLF